MYTEIFRDEVSWCLQVTFKEFGKIKSVFTCTVVYKYVERK